jgi:acetyltransferase-like isoleucine patch superfamily enzyme
MTGVAHNNSVGQEHDPLPVWFVTRVINKLHSMYLSAVYPFASIGKSVSFHCTSSVRNPQLIAIGNKVIVYKDTWLHTVLRKDTGGPTLIIDDGCVINRRCHIVARNRIHIERDVMLAANVLIMDHDHNHEDVTVPIKHQGITEGGKIRIEQGSIIGQGTVILCSKGELVLGRNCVVGANSVVTKSVAPYSVVSGNPARVVKQFDFEKQTWVLGAFRSAEAELVK